MAKRRLNKRFLGYLGGGAVALAVLGVGALKLKNRFTNRHPEKFLAAGREALARKDYVTARENLAHAAALSHPDAQLDVLIGDAVNGLASKDPDNVAAARGEWEQALTIDPGNVTAMERLIHFWRDQMQLHTRPGERAQAAGQLKNAAKNLRTADSGNHLANVNYFEATLEMMLDGMQSNAADTQEAREALLRLSSEDPADAEIPYYVARTDIWRGQEAGRADDPEGQAKAFATAQKVMGDAVRDQPDNASMHFRAGEILLQLGSAESGGKAPSTEAKDVISRGMSEIDRARQLATPDEEDYLDINLYDARMAMERPVYAPNAPMAANAVPTSAPAGDAGAQNALVAPGPTGANQHERSQVAESIYREVLSHRPNDPATRIALAELLSGWRGRRDEAIALLSQPLVDDHPEPGVKGTLLPFFQAQANVRLLSMLIDAIDATKDAAKRQTLLASADALCDRVYGRNPDSAVVVGMKGRLELIHNHMVDATQTLRHALALTDPQDPSQQRSRFELMYNLARACEAAQQTGEAKKLAVQIVGTYGHFIPARMMLARLLISEHDYAGATPHIDFLESILPSNPELTIAVERMRIATLDPVRDADRIKGYYNRLPEGTRDERMDKAQLAVLVKYDDEVLRLKSLVHAQFPGDVDAAVGLASWYQAHGQQQKAHDVLREALAVNPSDTTLLAAKLQVDGNAAAGSSLAQNNAEPGNAGATAAAPDEFNNQVAQMKVARDKGDMAAFDLHLAAAEKLKPDEPRVWDAMFSRAVELSNWDRASIYLEKLAAANSDHAGGLLYRVRYDLARNDLQKASELALQLTREKPEFSQSWCMLGLVQEAAGSYDDAVASFEQALERQTQNLEAIKGIIDCSYSTGNIQQAKRYIDLGCRVAPNNGALKEMALAYELTYGDPQNVIAPRLEAMQAAPEREENWANLAAAYVAAAQSRTRVQDSAAAADYYAKATSTLRQAMAKFPDSTLLVARFSKMSVDSGDFAGAEQAMLNFVNQPARKGKPQSATMLGDFYELAGKPDQAVKVLNNYLASPYQPTDHDGDIAVELRLSGLLAKLNRYDDGLAALAGNPQDPSVIRQRVSLLINAGRTADAEKALNTLAAAGPLPPDLLTLKGVAAINAGRLPEARESFDQVIAAQPNNVYALTERALTSIRQRPADYAAALTDLRHARDLAPQDMDIRLQIVDADRNSAQPDEAIKELEAAVHLAPTNKRIRLTLIDLYCSAKPPRWTDAESLLRETQHMPTLADDADFMHAEAAMDLGRDDYPKARQVIEAAMQKAPGNLSMVHTYYDVLLRTKDFDQILSHSSELLSSNQDVPTLWWVYPYRAEALLRLNEDKPGAAAELDHGLAATIQLHDLNGMSQIIRTYATLLGPDEAIKVAAARAQTDPHWLLLAADLCREKGDADGAINWLEMALSKFDLLSAPDQEAVLRSAATEYLAKTPADTLKSADAYRRLIKRSPNDLQSLNNLACILVEPGPAYQPKEALDYSERAFNLMSHAGQDQPLIKDTYGWTLIANGRSEEGLSLIQDALGKMDFAEGHYHLAEGFLKRQPPSSEDAASELTKAMQILDQAERDGKPVDDSLKSRVQEELKRARSGLTG
jgi:tetratricopeptide (TPR) repeat protein